MKTLRTELGNTLFKYAAWVYDSKNPVRKKFGNFLFKYAAWVSPDKKSK